MSVHLVMFYCSLVLLVISISMGVVGIWIPDVWRSDVGWKLLLTSLVLLAGTSAATLITKWLQ